MSFNLSDLKANAHIHFIGIGGISMSGLAQIMIKNRYKVTGSDRAESKITKKLESLGSNIYYEHSRENVHGADLVVYTAAVHDDNPEIQECKAAGIRLIDRAEFLGAIMKKYKHAVCVAGTHGKTTTTSMLAHALIYAKKDPTISVGGVLDLIEGNIKVGNSDYFVTEACEYTNSFLKFFPTIALITNIEEDHLDFFSGIDEIIDSFRRFAMLTKDVGKVIAYGADKNIQKTLADTGLDIITYGMSEEFEYYAENITYIAGFPQFDLMNNGKKKCTLKLNVPGEHNILNSLATFAICELFGIDAETAALGIATFKGTHRRFERKGNLNGATIIDDYAHHPTEIKATLNAACAFTHNKIWCVFQPHTYTRTKTLWNDFVTSFNIADEIILTDIYAAREKFDGVTKSEDLAKAIFETGKNVRYVSEFEDVRDILRKEVQKDDIVFTMGAGNIVDVSNGLVE